MNALDSVINSQYISFSHEQTREITSWFVLEIDFKSNIDLSLKIQKIRCLSRSFNLKHF
jgi:hypothetical protein